MKLKAFVQNRGFSIMIAMAVTVMLTLLGTLVLDSVNIDLTLARTDRASQRALSIAEAGLTWGMEKLRTSYSFETATPSYATVLALIKVQDDDPAGCPNSTVCKLYDWRQLPDGKSVSYGSGTFQVAVRDDDDGDLNEGADLNKTIMLRSLGKITEGNDTTSRLIEIIVSTQ